MAWSIFKEGGGKGTAQAWAQSLLQAIGAPVTPSNTQVIYDWEVSEGGGGKYNPLNQGPVPGHPELTTTGSQFGGGAADYKSYSAGIQGAADYLSMSNFKAIQQALKAGNADAARAAIIASPWAGSHYANGSAFSTEPLPGQASSLTGITDANFVSDGTNDLTSSLGGSIATGILGSVASALGVNDLVDLMERAALLLVGFLLLMLGVIRLSGQDKRIKQVYNAVKGGLSNADSKSGSTESI
jgi:hypothetical protein